LQRAEGGSATNSPQRAVDLRRRLPGEPDLSDRSSHASPGVDLILDNFDDRAPWYETNG